MKTTKRTMTKKFYVGNEQFAKQLFHNGESPNYHTFTDAVAKAEKRMIDRPEIDCLVIVQVVHIIRRPQPTFSFIHEDVR